MPLTRASSFLIILLWLPMSLHAEMVAFLPGSMEQITASRKGEPFLLVLWSVECPPCMKELHQLGEMRDRFGANTLVLVSTDGEADRESAWDLINANKLGAFENRFFADNFPERLRHEIDPNWFGELPRAYLYQADHQRHAHSGVLSEAAINQWLKAAKPIQ